MTTNPANTTTPLRTVMVDRFLDGIASATIPATDAWTVDATLDATVPNWRFTAQGADAIREVYSSWYTNPGRFEQLRKLPTPLGYAVEYFLTWEEKGVSHAVHHAHLLTLAGDGRIADDHVWCGGRWDAALLAEIQAADQ